MERVGVLALQGGYQRHLDCLARLGVAARPVRRAADLDGCTALILPGGESTSMTRLGAAHALLPALAAFARVNPVMGTCAGLILMSRSDDPRVASLGILDVTVARNAYGRQAQSFQAVVHLGMPGLQGEFPGTFIRAPQILEYGPEVAVLARHAGQPVLVAQGGHLGMSFHPELSGDPRLHAAWLRQTRHSAAPAPPQQKSA